MNNFIFLKLLFTIDGEAKLCGDTKTEVFSTWFGVV